MSNTIADARVMARGVAPWSDKERANMRRMAAMDFRHDHKELHKIRPASERDLVRDNCAACVLEMVGRMPKKTGKEPPNHCMWLRLYIQTGRAIPGGWFEAEMNENETRNPAFYAAVLRDIRTWGIAEFIRPGKVVREA